ncbi:hypothetical protein PVAND_012181 [Polypedilum vanderplanki]|uniref:AXH domain-containing protein n=1 Tax=Polypedilum vanderplanki TaxID=319348 RepID=A0A9J6CLM1_POLVA|nr:hypothetical protein PVAND_012181 [Polypedilum vanderplanki]
MLSAVELHTGANSGFYPSFSRPPVSSDVPYTPPSMSETEFARPKPKNIAALNGLSSPTHKYSHHHEQNGPVNLAVNHHAAAQRQVEKEHGEKEIDVVGLGTSSSSPSFVTSSSPRISSSSYPAASLGSNAYQALNYNFYGNRYGAPLFPHRSAYTQHHASRPPTYLPSQLEYPSYLSAAAAMTSYGSTAYSSSLTQSTAAAAEALSQAVSHKSANERSHSMSSLTNGHHHPYSMKDKEPKSAGPRLIGSSSDDLRNGSSSNNNNNFKVPSSGKEGSLKHRILTTSTRPHDNGKHGTINHPANRSPISNNSYLNFTRGSLIELSNGSLRRVEDLRTEDFVMSAEKSQDLQLADSTVVKILPAINNYVMITFSYDSNRSKVDIEAKMEHPFFVYGQGWASCNPEGSMHAFGLKCNRLQVGDVCISLKPREQKSSPPLSPLAQKRPREIFQHPPKEQQQELMPQNLSRRPSASIPTSATDTMSSYSPSLYNHLQMSLFAAAASHGRAMSSFGPFLNQDDVAAHLQSHELNTSLNNNNSPDKLPMLMSKNSSSSSTAATVTSDDYADDLQSRKRRWSAPDIDGDEQQPRKV